MGVVLGVAGAAHAVLEGHRHQPGGRLIAVGAVVFAAHADAVALEVADGDAEGFGAAFSQQPPGLRVGAGGQQRHALGRAEAVVEGLHPRIHPLAPMLPGTHECFAIQLVGVQVQDLAAETLDRLHLDPLGPAEPAGRLDRAQVALERLGGGQVLQLLNTLLVGAGSQGLQQWPGGQLGARVGPPQRRTADFTGGRVEALEHRPHLLGAGGPLQPGCGGGAAHEPAR
jgi:hypothetical protein